MKVSQFLELFKDLDSDTEIEVPELRIFGSNWNKIGKVELSLELFKIKDRQSKETLVRQNTRYFLLIILLTIVCLTQLIMVILGDM